MRIMIIRHGEPDNPNQTLTPQGFKEVEALRKLYGNYPFDEVYASPLARAQLTAKGVLKDRDIPIITKDWLAEFHHPVTLPETEQKVLNWDFMPSFFTQQDDLYRNDKYLDTPLMQSADMKKYYNEVTTEFDKILASNGYVRTKNYYSVEKENRKTLVFFCHFAMMGVLMSHLMGIPYVLLTQVFACAPTGVTIFNSEEREKGIAQFRCSRYGDISHLTMEHIEPSFHGRFCEIFDSNERH